MDTISVQEVLAVYKALILRALFIVEKAPYWAYVEEPKLAKLSIDGADAILSWPGLDREYEGYSISVRACRFPAELLTASKERISAWKKEQARLSAIQEAAAKEKRLVAAEAAEREQLAALAKKYGQP